MNIYIYAHAYATDRQIDRWIYKVVLSEGGALALHDSKSRLTEAITDMCEHTQIYIYIYIYIHIAPTCICHRYTDRNIDGQIYIHEYYLADE